MENRYISTPGADPDKLTVPVKTLQRRYKIARSGVWRRMHDIGIKPVKIGRQSYITERERDRLDRLDSKLSKGDRQTIAAFLREESGSLETEVATLKQRVATLEALVNQLISESRLNRSFLSSQAYPETPDSEPLTGDYPAVIETAC